jgi:PAS domain S-box-containing protein
MSNQNQKPQQGLENIRKQLLPFIDAAPAAIAILDREMKYILTSRRFLTDYKLKQQDLFGRSHYEVFPETPERLKEIHRRCLAGASESANEETFPRADGRLDWVQWEVQPWYEDSGEIGGIIIFSEVITERKRREKEDLDLFSTMNDTAFVISFDCDFLAVNEAASRVLGYSREELLSMGPVDIDPYLKPEDIQQLVSGMRIDPQQIFETEHRTKRGDIIPVEVSSSQVNFKGSPAILSIARDITDRKSSERALKESEERYRNFLKVAPVGIAVHQDGRVVFTNPAGLRILGADSYEQIIGKPLDEFIHPDGLENARIRIQGMLAGEEGHYPAEERYLQLDGTQITVEVMSSPLMFNGEPAIQVIVIDITERKQAEERQEKLHAQLLQAQKMESVGRLAGGVAHDYNNVLSVIIGYSELALDKLNTTDPLYSDLLEIFNAAEHSRDITRQLLAFARKETITPEVLDLNVTLESMLSILRRLIGEDIDLVWLPGADLWPVRIDPSQLNQILANLCVNARDAISDVGKITIKTDTLAFDADYIAEHPEFVAGDFILLSVRDNGCGMDSETLENIFEPFFTTKELGQGTGLGLATVYGIVKQNDGFIDVCGKPGEDTIFRIFLPRYRGNIPEELGPVDKKTPKGGNETVLVVEDEISILKLVERALSGLGYRVLTATSPSEALQLADAHANEISLLVTDVVMPKMNGRELAKKMVILCPQLKSLYMSGYTADVIAHRGILNEGFRFIQKPFSTQELASKVRAALDDNE